MNKLNFFILLTLLLINSVYSQNIINGDFEINTASTCYFNLTDSSYNNLMSNSWGFGNNSGSGMDIQETSCGYANSPHNAWFVSVCRNVNLLSETDAFSLKLNQNLITGNTYQLSYLEYGYYTGTGTYLNTILEIGLSTDSLSFGQIIYSSLPNINTWTLRTFNFIAPNNGKYLTVRNTLSDSVPGWNFVDNFQMSSIEGTNELLYNSSFSIYPDPFSTELNVSLNDNKTSEVILYDITSRKLLQQMFMNTTVINTEQLAKGIYIYEVRDKDGVIEQGKVVKE